MGERRQIESIIAASGLLKIAEEALEEAEAAFGRLVVRGETSELKAQVVVWKALQIVRSW